MQACTHAGENGLLWHAIAASAVLAIGRPRYRARSGSSLIAWSPTRRVKQVVRRAGRCSRTELPPLVPTISGRSYPSAHASTSFAAAGALSGALPAPPLYAVAAAMALSRPYLGVHYPTDVAGRRAARAGGRAAAREDRHRRPAERGQVLALQRAHARRRAGGQLPVHHASSRTWPWCGVPDERLERVAETVGAHADRARDDRSSTTSPAWCAAPTRARGSATSSSATSARPTRSCTWCARTTTRRWSIPRAASTRSPTSRRSRRSCCTPTSSRPSAGSSGWPSRRSRCDKELIAEERWLREVVEALQAGRAGAHGAAARRRARARRSRLSALTSKPVLYVANVAEGEPLEPPAELVEHAERAARAPPPSARGSTPSWPSSTTTRRPRCARSSACDESGLDDRDPRGVRAAPPDHVLHRRPGQGGARPGDPARARAPGRRPARCTPTWSAASWPPR